MKGLDATNGSEFVSMKNMNRCNFTAMVWDSTAHELIAGDEKGYLGVWNVYHDRPIFWGPLFKESNVIIDLSIRDNRRELLVATEINVYVY